MDGSGNVIAGYGYDVFGTIRSQSGSSDNYWLFTGEQRDGQPGITGGSPIASHWPLAASNRWSQRKGRHLEATVSKMR